MNDDYTRKYRQTLQLGLIHVIEELFPEEKLAIPYSILDGVYCELIGSAVSSREVNQIEAQLKSWVESGSRLEFQGRHNNCYQYKLGDKVYSVVNPAFEHTSMLKEFHLIYFPPGFILHFSGDKDDSVQFVAPGKLAATYNETHRWLENLNLSQIKDINSFIKKGKWTELITLAEALHDKKIADIADLILQEKKTMKIILISGPSSSGKTTFAQRLSTQLRVNGLKPVPLSLDNYFVNREDTPRDASGQLDFDALEALDLPLLNEQLAKLVKGQEVEVPIFDFLTGHRASEGYPLQLSPDNILVIEGIHALNPNLLQTINRHTCFKIYISALFLLNIDSYNRVPTTDARLIRRMVRDNSFRGFEPERTLKQWASVRRGEDTSVFKFQEEADVMLNSSLLYELNALRSFAEPLLQGIPEQSPYNGIATRLLNVLSFFEPMPTDKIPSTSILREFIGGSIYAED